MSGWWAAAFVAQWVLLVVLCVVVVALARQVGTLHLRMGPRGRSRSTRRAPLSERPCRPSTPEAPTARRSSWEERGNGGSSCSRRPTCIICREVAPALPAAARAADLVPQVFHDPDAERAFEVPGTPFLLVLDELGIVRAKGTVNTLEQVEGLVDTAERRMREEGERWAS